MLFVSHHQSQSVRSPSAFYANRIFVGYSCFPCIVCWCYYLFCCCVFLSRFSLHCEFDLEKTSKSAQHLLHLMRLMTIIDRSKNNTQPNPLQFQKSFSWRSNAVWFRLVVRNGAHSHQNFMIGRLNEATAHISQWKRYWLFIPTIFIAINKLVIYCRLTVCVCVFFLHWVLSCEQNGTQKLIYSIWLSHLFDRWNKNKPLERKSGQFWVANQWNRTWK